jgi:hypothetical protein
MNPFACIEMIAVFPDPSHSEWHNAFRLKGHVFVQDSEKARSVQKPAFIEAGRPEPPSSKKR